MVLEKFRYQSAGNTMVTGGNQARATFPEAIGRRDMFMFPDFELVFREAPKEGPSHFPIMSVRLGSYFGRDDEDFVLTGDCWSLLEFDTEVNYLIAQLQEVKRQARRKCEHWEREFLEGVSRARQGD